MATTTRAHGLIGHVVVIGGVTKGWGGTSYCSLEPATTTLEGVADLSTEARLDMETRRELDEPSYHGEWDPVRERGGAGALGLPAEVERELAAEDLVLSPPNYGLAPAWIAGDARTHRLVLGENLIQLGSRHVDGRHNGEGRGGGHPEGQREQHLGGPGSLLRQGASKGSCPHTPQRGRQAYPTQHRTSWLTIILGIAGRWVGESNAQEQEALRGGGVVALASVIIAASINTHMTTWYDAIIACGGHGESRQRSTRGTGQAAVRRKWGTFLGHTPCTPPSSACIEARRSWRSGEPTQTFDRGSGTFDHLRFKQEKGGEGGERDQHPHTSWASPQLLLKHTPPPISPRGGGGACSVCVFCNNGQGACGSKPLVEVEKSTLMWWW